MQPDTNVILNNFNFCCCLNHQIKSIYSERFWLAYSLYNFKVLIGQKMNKLWTQIKFSAYFGLILLPENNIFTSSMYVEISMYILLLRED